MDFIKKQANSPLWGFLKEAADAVPAYVMESEYPTEESVERLPDHLFADTVTRTYPIHTKAASWMSYVTARGNGDDKHAVRIKDAAAIYGIVEDLDAVDAYFNIKSANAHSPAEVPYALQVDFGQDGRYGEKYAGVQKFFPLDTRSNVEDAALKLASAVNEMPIEWVHLAASNIVKRAKELEMDISEFSDRVCRWGGEYAYNPDAALEVAQLRKKLASAETGELYEQLVRAVDLNPEDLPQALEVWAELDRQNGIKYSAETPDPYSAAFCGVAQTALEKVAHISVQMGDYVIPIHDFVDTNWDGLAPRMRRTDYDTFRTCIKEAAQKSDCSGLQKFLDGKDEDIRTEIVDWMFHNSPADAFQPVE